MLLVAIAIAGTVFGEEAVRGEINGTIIAAKRRRLHETPRPRFEDVVVTP